MDDTPLKANNIPITSTATVTSSSTTAMEGTRTTSGDISTTTATKTTTPTPTTKLSRAQDFDDILEVVGSLGAYQKRMLFVLLMPVSFFVAVTANLLLFQMVVPEHWCHAPGRENTSLTVAEWHNLTRPRSNDSGELSKCLMHDFEVIYEGNASKYYVSNDTKECLDGWEFDTSQFSATVATTLGWVCERGHYSHYTLSTMMAGNAVGTFLLPILADKYVGRRLMFFVALTLHVVFTIPLLWVSNNAVHILLRFLQGLAFETNYLMPYTIYMELISIEHRAVGVMLSFLAWTFGMCFTTLVAWLAPNWQHLLVISLVPTIFGFLYWRYLPESPRWLLAKGKVSQCADVLLQIGTTNGAKQVSRVEVEAQLGVLMLRQPVEQPLSAMLAYPRVTTRAIMLFLMAFSQYMTYGVTLLSMTVLSNPFLAHLVLSLFEVPSNLLACLAAHYLGRRFMGYCNFLLLAACWFAAPFCIKNEWLLLTVVGFAKLFSTCGLYLAMLMTSEVLPTPVRTSGTGLAVVSGLLGMVVAPHVLHSGLGEAGRYWILMTVAVATALTMIPLPETLGLQLPQTFQDAEELGKDRPFTSWIHHWNVHRFLQSSRPLGEELNQDLLEKPS